MKALARLARRHAADLVLPVLILVMLALITTGIVPTNVTGATH